MEALIAILAGGRATRMGGDKVLRSLGGRPLISYPLAAAEAAGDAIVVAKPQTRLPEVGEPGGDATVLREPAEPAHPLCGIVAALREAAGRPVLAVGADMPFVTAELLGWMAALDEGLALPDHGGRLHPLLGRYDPALLPDLERALEASAPMQETVASLGPRRISTDEMRPFGDPDRLLFNVNDAAGLQAAEGML